MPSERNMAFYQPACLAAFFDAKLLALADLKATNRKIVSKISERLMRGHVG
jgi:hypothetical protein